MAEHDRHSGTQPTIEDLVLLQSTVESLRQERDQLLRRLQAADSSARERLQLTEARYREALHQLDALKRAAQQVRQQLEQELANAREELQHTTEQARQWRVAAESMHQRAVELEALLESAQARIADLETENAVLQAEMERLQATVNSTEAQLEELRTALARAEEARALEASHSETVREALHRLEEDHATVARKLEEALGIANERAQQNETLVAALQKAEAQIHALETELSSLRSELATLRTLQEEERRRWEGELVSRTEQWAEERDSLARALEEEQDRSASLEREAGALRAQLCSLQMRAQLDAEQVLRLQEELEVARAERVREREIFEAIAREREAEWQARLEELQREFERYREEAEQKTQTLRSELEEARAATQEATDAIQRLQEALETATTARARLEEEVARYAQEARVWREACEEHERRRASDLAKVADYQDQLSQVQAELAASAQSLIAARAELAEEHRRATEQATAWNEERRALMEKISDLELEVGQTRAEIEQACWQIQVLDRGLQKATVEQHAAALAAAQARAAGARWELAFRLAAQAHNALAQQALTEGEKAERHRNWLGRSLSIFATEREDLRRQRAELEKTLAQQMQRQQELEARYAKLEREHARLQQEATELREALHEAEARASAHANELTRHFQAKERLLEEYQANLSASERNLALLQQEYNELSRQVGELQAALGQARAEHSHTAARYEEQLAALRAELTSWRERAATLAATADEHSAQIRAQEEALLAKEHAYEQLHAQYRTLQQHTESLVARCEEYSAAYEKTLAELEQTRQHLATLQEQSVTILQAQEILTQESAALRGELEHLKSECERLSHARDHALQERDRALARWRDSETRRQKEQANYLAVRQQLDAEREALRDALEAARAQQAQLQAHIALLQREKDSRSSSSTVDVLELERERGELKAQVEKLSAVIRQLGQEREEQRVAALQAQSALTARLDELAAERGALSLRVAELETLVSQLDRECERLRKERVSPEEVRKYKAEVSRLEARVEELERLRAEAAQNHSAVVAGYLLELNQRTDLLQAKEGEVQELQRALEKLQAYAEELQSRLDAEREERAQLEAALDELRRAAASGSQVLKAKAQSAIPSAKAPTLRIDQTAKATLHSSATPLSAPASTITGAQGPLAQLSKGGGLVVVHLEESKECREHVQRLLKQLPNVRYLNTLELPEQAKDGPLLLAVNLLNRAHDPIAALTRVVRHTGAHGIFAYCADGKFGFLVGEATFFPSPLDVDSCATWLMSAYGSVQRLLVASNNIEMTSELRNALAKIRCSASVALDYRQVVELIPLIQPEVVLIDLSLPRADGLRLISRLRNDEKTSALPLGILLPEHQRVAELRQHATRAAREGSFSVDELVKVLARELGLPEPHGEKEAGALAARPG